ncbi:MAG TPA: VWA domain-containing protein [Anaerolineales bacterium]|nr:VWA domain-containing protein [Anaerolineales bacterium]
MRVLWPVSLALLLLIPLVAGVYILSLRRKRRLAVRYSSLALVREALPRRSRWRRHLPFALFLISLAGLSMAMARPVADVEVPLSRTTIVLAMDVSRSMCSTDVDPNRLSVAQQAALAFVGEAVTGTQMGIVAFSDFAQIVVPPTRDKEVLREAIEGLTTSIGTAIGSATLKSLDAIAETNPDVAPSGVHLGLVDEQGAQQPEAYLPHIIVLLTDGANTRGPTPLDAARQAADRRIRVYTVGFGTTQPGRMVCSQRQMGGDLLDGSPFGGGFGRRSGLGFADVRRFMLLDEPTLRGVAELTGGKYYRAENARQLLDVFLSLPSQITLQKQTQELSVFFAGAGAVFALLAVSLSLAWNRLP